MSDHVPPSASMWRLRELNPMFRHQWKITARYEVWLKPNVVMRCIRVGHYGKPYTVRHYSEAEFLRLFVLIGPPHILPKPSLEISA
jgi:hypothetical protein